MERKGERGDGGYKGDARRKWGKMVMVDEAMSASAGRSAE